MWSLSDLPWLVPPPDDFRARCAAADQRPDGGAIARLAGFRLNANHLVRLSRTIETALAGGHDLRPLTPFRLGVLGNGTTDLFRPSLAAAAARHGVALQVVGTDYDQLAQTALDPASPINTAGCDAVLLAVDHRALPLAATPAAASGEAERMVDRAFGELRELRDGLRRHCPLVIFQTLARPPEPLFGSFDIRLEASTRSLLHRFNEHLRTLAAERGDAVLDVAALAETVGLQHWHHPGQWALYKLPFAQQMVPLFADHVGRLLGALRGRGRKVLVLDLDNTLWGGVIGDDGLSGLRIGQGDGVGEAFLSVQRAALDLHDRGVLLAVCSKNDEAVARAPFRDHAEMVLRETHFAAFLANWSDKASNLETITRILGLGLDSLVLLDDNPAERHQVREALPMVAVPELPDDPALYPRTLLAAGYFEAAAFSADDRQRTAQYRANAARSELLGASRDLAGYLRSLEMVATVAPFDAQVRPRVTQLINKTNQFNLTGRRCTEAEVEAMEGDPGTFTLCVRLADRFGDNGLISALAGRRTPDAWDIDIWVMSCRVLGREVERFVLNRLAEAARAAGAIRLTGQYIPTGRNGLVGELYRTLGFVQLGKIAADGAQSWELALAGFVPEEPPIRSAGS